GGRRRLTTGRPPGRGSRGASSTGSYPCACMQERPTSRGRAARIAARTLPRKRRSTTDGVCPRSASAAPMYSSPSGSTRKKGPRPKRSFPGSGRMRRTFIARRELYIAPDAAKGGGGVRYRRRWSRARPQEMGEPRSLQRDRVRRPSLWSALAAGPGFEWYQSRRQLARDRTPAANSKRNTRELPGGSRSFSSGSRRVGPQTLLRVWPVDDRCLAAAQPGLHAENYDIRRR